VELFKIILEDQLFYEEFKDTSKN